MPASPRFRLRVEFINLLKRFTKSSIFRNRRLGELRLDASSEGRNYRRRITTWSDKNVLSKASGFGAEMKGFSWQADSHNNMENMRFWRPHEVSSPKICDEIRRPEIGP